MHETRGGNFHVKEAYFNWGTAKNIVYYDSYLYYIPEWDLEDPVAYVESKALALTL